MMECSQVRRDAGKKASAAPSHSMQAVSQKLRQEVAHAVRQVVIKIGEEAAHDKLSTHLETQRRTTALTMDEAD